MKNSFIKVQLESLKRIKVLVFSEMSRPNDLTFTLFKDGGEATKLQLIKSTATASLSIFELALPHDIVFGHHYSLVASSFPAQVVDVSSAVSFPEFDSLFNYSGDDLGAIYQNEKTDFNLWAPLAADVYLNLENERGQFDTYRMNRTDYGVYRISIKGDLLNRKYNYLVDNSGVSTYTNDPWGKGTSLNSKYSAVVDINKLKEMGHIKPTNKINSHVDSIIYEVSVRDFTEDKNTDIVNKGKYLGFIEEGRKTKGGNPAGLDYLKYLGITHVQLNPIIDFRGVDDIDVLKTYNWGYDPISFFAVEGSYSTNPSEPMARLIELKQMINTLHKNNIRVVMDVVYNHIYGYMDSCFEKVVPNYFFRRTKAGHIANASGCGNDFATEKYMARKAIIDSIRYFVDYFDVDGFRYDLMGLIDIETINRCAQVTKAIKPDAIIYGEGWNMGYELPFEQKACSENARRTPLVGFFNSMFRDVVKGSTFNLKEKGYCAGNTDCSTGLEFLLTGSVLPYTFNPLYLDATQSINYVECHDNGTLFDKYREACEDEDLETIYKRIKFTNVITVLSNGIPFIHMGQEIGQTKNGHGNTYNIPVINNMVWSEVDERFEMVTYLKEVIRARKEGPFFHKYLPTDIDESIKFYQHYDENTLYATIDSSNNHFVAILNPTKEIKNYTFDNDHYTMLDSCAYPNDKSMKTKTGVIPPLSVIIFGKC